MEKLCGKDTKAREDKSGLHKPVREPSSTRTGSNKMFCRMSAAEHLDEARTALDDGYKVNANPLESVWGRVNDARKHLQAIEPQASQFVAAQGLLQKALSRERYIENVCTSIANQLMVKQREMLADELEQFYLSRGLLVEVELSGPGKTSIRLGCALFCEASVDRIADGSKFFGHLKRAGFKRVVMGDTEENVWAYPFQ